MKLYYIIILLTGLISCSTHRPIMYNFQPQINDSLEAGIRFWEKIHNKPIDKIRIVAVITESCGNLEVCLQNIPYSGKNGINDLISNSNRYLNINNKYKFPVIFQTDELSTFIQKEKIIWLPMGGYYIKLRNENGKQTIIQTSPY